MERGGGQSLSWHVLQVLVPNGSTPGQLAVLKPFSAFRRVLSMGEI